MADDVMTRETAEYVIEDLKRKDHDLSKELEYSQKQIYDIENENVGLHQEIADLKDLVKQQAKYILNSMEE